MKKNWFCWTLTGALLLAGAGCAESPTDATATAGSDAAATAPTDGSTAAAAPDVKLTEPDTAEPVTDAAAAAPAGEVTKPEMASTSNPNVDPLIKGLEFPNVNIQEMFNEQKAAYTANSKDPEAVTGYVGLIANLGMYHSQQGDQKRAHEAFVRAGELADKAAAEEVKLPRELVGTVFYNVACVRSLEGKADESLALLVKAIDNGFSEMGLLSTDTDLDNVRKLPAFSEKMVVWEAAAKELLVAHAKEELAAGESFPFDFALTDVAGQPIKLADMKGKVCIVDIWGTWCPPCRAEIPSFIQLQQKFGEAGFQMVGLNQENGADEAEKAKKVVDYISSAGMNYPCALIDDAILETVPDFSGFPTTLFIDRTGKVRMKAVGLHEYAYLEAVVEALLAEEAPASSEPAAAAPATDSGAAATPAADAPAAETPAANP